MSLYIISAGCIDLLVTAEIFPLWKQTTRTRSRPGCWVAFEEQPAFERDDLVCLLYTAYHLQQS